MSPMQQLKYACFVFMTASGFSLLMFFSSAKFILNCMRNTLDIPLVPQVVLASSLDFEQIGLKFGRT